MTLSMLGDDFSAQVDLPGFSLRRGARAANPYLLAAQTHELVDDDLQGRASLTLVSNAEGLVIGASLRVARAVIDDAACRPRAEALLTAFLGRVQCPLGLAHPVVADVWSGRAVEREQNVRGRVLMVEQAPAFGGPAVRVSWQEAPRLERACAACGEGNLDSFAFCAHCGKPRAAVGRLEVTPPPLPPPPVPIPVEADLGAGAHDISVQAAPPLVDAPTIAVPVPEAAPPLVDAPTVAVQLPEALPPLVDAPTVAVQVPEAPPERVEVAVQAGPLPPAAAVEAPRVPVAPAPADAEQGPHIHRDPPTIPVMLMEKLGSSNAPVLQDPPTVPVRKPISHNPFVPVAPPGMAPVADAWTAPEPPPAAPAPVAVPLHDHHGDAVRANDDLFVGAPPAIGEVRSAATSLTRGHDSLWRRILRTLPWAVPAAAAAWAGVEYGVLRWVKADAATLATYRWVAPALVLLLVVWLRLPTRRVLSYVGSRGIALCDVRFRVWPPRRPPVGVLEFARARDLTVAIAHHKGYLEFAYVWRGHDGRELLRLARRYRSTADGQRPLDRGEARFYDFCRAAERSWTLYVVEGARAAIRSGQAVSFPVYSPNCSELQVREGNLVFRLASGEAVVPAGLLEYVAVSDGKVHFTPEEGDISLPCADIGNVTVLLLVVQHHLGVAVR